MYFTTNPSLRESFSFVYRCELLDVYTALKMIAPHNGKLNFYFYFFENIYLAVIIRRSEKLSSLKMGTFTNGDRKEVHMYVVCTGLHVEWCHIYFKRTGLHIQTQVKNEY